MLYDRAAIAQGWIDYWELPGAKEESEIYRDVKDSEVDQKGVISEPFQWPAGETNIWLYIDMPSGSTIILSVNLYGYYAKGWGVNWGLFDI